MKQSIRFKITFLLTTMVVLTIFSIWFINRTFLSDYYLKSKINILERAYQKIEDICENSEEAGGLSEEDTVKMERLANDSGIDIYVIDKDLNPYYPALENYGLRERDYISQLLYEYIFLNEEAVENKKPLKESEDYWIFRQYDRNMDSNYIELVDNDLVDINIAYFFWGYNSDGNNNSNRDEQSDSVEKTHQDDTIILLRSNFESIEESVQVANKFLAYIGIAAVLIGSFAMFIISKQFTKPILDLSTIAKKMTDLDFEVKYDVKSKDEIGELGSSINLLSDKLEATISELKQANNELVTDIQKKTEIDEMRKEFLSNVSHELKTPISLIQGYAEGLKENINDDEESRDFYCEVIMDEANKMNQMVKKLLSLNELEFGNNQANFERFDIVSLIRSVVSATEILLKQKETTLLFDQTEPVYVWADEYLIEQVVTNYISNAINHVDGQRIIEIKLVPRDGIVRIAIFNTGENIPEEDLDKIWIKFYKVDKARTREYGGSGIGLSIVKAIMNSHNQECGVINRPIGVEFWFELDAKA